MKVVLFFKWQWELVRISRIDERLEHFTQYTGKENLLSLYIPARIGFVLKLVD